MLNKSKVIMLSSASHLVDVYEAFLSRREIQAIVHAPQDIAYKHREVLFLYLSFVGFVCHSA